MAKRLTLFILAALLLGIATGAAFHFGIADGTAPAQARLDEVAKYFSIITGVFLHLIKMIIAPLVFATLVSGIVHMGDSSALGRVGLRAMGWFLGASLVSLSLGLLLVNLFRPGAGMGLVLPAVDAKSGVATPPFDIKDFILHIFPESMIDAMAHNEILQIVVFSIFVGVALAAVGERGALLSRAVEQMVDVMLRITDYVMRIAPLAVFAAVAGAVTEKGLGILVTFSYFIASFYVGLALFWLLLAAISWVLLRHRAAILFRNVREPVLLAFSTASSEAALPQLFEALDRSGVRRRIASFVVPLGYSFNLDGSMMYMAFAVMFIAQAYGIEMTLFQQVTALLVLMVTSKGVAGVPRASLVVVAATLSYLHLPEAGLLLVVAIDHFMDMGRTATNVMGNAVASAVIDNWEGVGADTEQEAAPNAALADKRPLAANEL